MASVTGFNSFSIFSANPTTARPDVTYTVRRDLDGSSQSIRLPGDHSPEALETTLLLIEREATAG
jgi:hypothetical protein